MRIYAIYGRKRWVVWLLLAIVGVDLSVGCVSMVTKDYVYSIISIILSGVFCPTYQLQSLHLRALRRDVVNLLAVNSQCHGSYNSLVLKFISEVSVSFATVSAIWLHNSCPPA